MRFGPRLRHANLCAIALAALATLSCLKSPLRRFFESCNAASDCESNQCSSGVCTRSCVAANECGDFGACVNQVCLPRPATCAADAGCSDTAAEVAATDVAAVCAEKPCRLLPPQCGCPAGQACYVPATAPVCLAPGAVAEGGACSKDNDCSAGSACITGIAMGSFCAPFCDLSQPAQCPSNVCLVTGLAGVGVCMVVCDPIAQSGCGARSCLLIGKTGGGYITACGKVGGKATKGGTCVGMADCLPGLMCAGGKCWPLCEVKSGKGCATACSPGVPALKPGAVEYGVCKG